MTTGGLAPCAHTDLLFEIEPTLDIRNVAHARNVYGDLAQQLVCRTGGLVHDLACHCPLVKPKIKEGQSKRFGMTRGGYADGYYNLPVGQLMENTEPVAEFIVPFFNWKIPVELRV